jgi:hypothetical protein
MPQSQEQHQYQALPESSVRLLEIQEDSQPNSIKGRLHIHQFNQCPPYTALSYTWGPEHPQQSILVDGMCFSIRQNLASFFNMTVTKRLSSRIKRHFPLFWIDQICIDQSNIPEKNHQVKLMADIYANAKRVVIWLGDAADDSDFAMQSLRGLRQIILNTRVPIFGYTTIYLAPVALLANHRFRDLLISPRLLKASSALAKRSYWERVWIIQEVLFAKAPVVCCGSRSIKWKHVLRLNETMDMFRDRSSDEWGALSRLVYVHKMLGRSIIGFLPHVKESKSSDPRDKVYALLALVKPNKAGEKLEADYSKSVTEVYDAVLEHWKDEFSVSKFCLMDLRHALDLCPGVHQHGHECYTSEKSVEA